MQTKKEEPGRLESIWVKPARRVPMRPAQSARLIEGRGIEGNVDRGGKRQVTVLDQSAWGAAAAEAGAEGLGPEARRANLVVSGVDLEGSAGNVLRVGNVRLEVHGETRPCERMDEAAAGMRQALDPAWRGGVYATVGQSGDIAVGAPVELVGQ